jgi:hypothetical protein
LDQPPLSDFRVSSPLDTYVVHEEIRGPVYGFWLACYAIQRRRGFYAYGKLCRQRPESVWDTPTAVAKISLGPRPTAESAFDSVYLAVEARLHRRFENQAGFTPTQPGQAPTPAPPA